MSDHANQRSLTGVWQWLIIAVALLLAVFHIVNALFPQVSDLTRNALHFAGFAWMCALIYPLRPNGLKKIGLWLDVGFGTVVALAAMYLSHAEDAIYANNVKFSTLDWLASAVVILGAIELTRRATGWIIPILIVLALSYVTWLGKLLSGVFAFKGLSLETVLFRSIYGDDAVFGNIASISATYVFLFILFGAFLLRSGAGEFVIDLSRAVAGRMVGGPGLVAVISSGLTGTISGSAVANTASTGVITIPMMKRAGFPAKFAAAVEASASTGGQLMPPIMGAGAFVMASYTQIAYETIVAVAALPALLYFASVAMFVRIEAKRQGLTATNARDITLGQAIKTRGASFIIPIAVLITMLVVGFTPTYAAVTGIVAVVVSSWLTKQPMGVRAIIEALVLGTKNMVMTAVLLCAVGLIINVIATAGIGNTFSLMIAQWADGNILLAIVLIGLASLVLGMGLPVTAAYIVLATLSAPALANMIADTYLLDAIVTGAVPESARVMFMLTEPDAMTLLASPMSAADASALLVTLPSELVNSVREQVVSAETLTITLLSAHMIIFWLSQDSNVTPPVCLASFTAAAIAKSKPMATGFASWKIAKGLYIMPVLFAFTPLISGAYSGDWLSAFGVFVFALVGIYALAGGLQGHLETGLSMPMRFVALGLGIGCLYPMLIVNVASAIGVFVLVLLTKDNSAKGDKKTQKSVAES